MFPRLGGFGAVGITLDDFAPRRAVVGKLFRRPIEKKGDAFTLVAIEAVVIQIVLNSSRSESVPVFLRVHKPRHHPAWIV